MGHFPVSFLNGCIWLKVQEVFLLRVLLFFGGCSKKNEEKDTPPTLLEEQTKPQDMVIMTVGTQKLT